MVRKANESEKPANIVDKSECFRKEIIKNNSDNNTKTVMVFSSILFTAPQETIGKRIQKSSGIQDVDFLI